MRGDVCILHIGEKWAGEASWGLRGGGGVWVDGGGIGADEAEGAGEMLGSRRLAGGDIKQKTDVLLTARVAIVRSLLTYAQR